MEPIGAIHYIREGKKGEIRYQENVTILDVSNSEVVYVNHLGEITVGELCTLGMANFIMTQRI